MNSSVKRLLGALLLIATIGLSSVLAIGSAEASDIHNHYTSPVHG